MSHSQEWAHLHLDATDDVVHGGASQEAGGEAKSSSCNEQIDSFSDSTSSTPAPSPQAPRGAQDSEMFIPEADKVALASSHACAIGDATYSPENEAPHGASPHDEIDDATPFSLEDDPELAVLVADERHGHDADPLRRDLDVPAPDPANVLAWHQQLLEVTSDVDDLHGVDSGDVFSIKAFWPSKRQRLETP